METSSSRIQTLKSLTTDTEALRALDALAAILAAYKGITPAVFELNDARARLAAGCEGVGPDINRALDALTGFNSPDLYPVLDFLETSIRAAK